LVDNIETIKEETIAWINRNRGKFYRKDKALFTENDVLEPGWYFSKYSDAPEDYLRERLKVIQTSIKLAFQIYQAILGAGIIGTFFAVLVYFIQRLEFSLLFGGIAIIVWIVSWYFAYRKREKIKKWIRDNLLIKTQNDGEIESYIIAKILESRKKNK